KRQASRLLILVVVMFALLWLPVQLHLLYSSIYGFPENPCYNVLSILFQALAYCNSCVNPIIYNHTSRDFREAFRQAL
ncbi:hypothetical protein HELRODRAFT_127323, partial [Helobdella robusta]|uniref:G-protein coupled receptors family 1 profile domain-containing protein n=1 Tax=Helobdella robusta TaxID=6412 RepID=T1EHD9_HELRO